MPKPKAMKKKNIYMEEGQWEQLEAWRKQTVFSNTSAFLRAIINAYGPHAQDKYRRDDNGVAIIGCTAKQERSRDE